MNIMLPTAYVVESWMVTFVLFLILSTPCFSQLPIDHWETVVYAEDDWSFRSGNTEPPFGWQKLEFNDAFWIVGPGGIVYEDKLGKLLIDKLLLPNSMNVIDMSTMSSGLYYYQLLHNLGSNDNGIIIVENH